MKLLNVEAETGDAVSYVGNYGEIGKRVRRTRCDVHTLKNTLAA